jgi:NAD(P)H-nitrite reductase large subunit
MVEKVLHIDRSQHIVTTFNKEKIGYQKLVLATGAEPLIRPCRGGDAEYLTIRKTVPYLNYLLDAMNQARSLCIVGCGYIGVEFAEESRKVAPTSRSPSWKWWITACSRRMIRRSASRSRKRWWG